MAPLQLKAETLAPDRNFCPLYQFEKNPTLCELESLLMKFSKKMCTSDHDDGDNVGGGDSGSDDCIAPLSRKVYGLKVLNLDFSELQSSKYTLGLQF